MRTYEKVVEGSWVWMITETIDDGRLISREQRAVPLKVVPDSSTLVKNFDNEIGLTFVDYSDTVVPFNGRAWVMAYGADMVVPVTDGKAHLVLRPEINGELLVKVTGDNISSKLTFVVNE